MFASEPSDPLVYGPEFFRRFALRTNRTGSISRNKKNYLYCVLLPHYPIRLSHNAIENKVYYESVITLYYFSNKEKKRIDRPDVLGVAKGR